ncbi:hypothetical protein EKE94_06140 [Mesobaculum littorinae]|uniref:Uncharacterized protein n=1 Tax=Mesobaculum littorinae TaxID=2486419 RepID=A0A438AID5_9RHOB|nr:hypothetical protein [Mesobaculum littorinae]RVV98496.1 hypothetical protein EKE94_06140 [Mesobaculum littorinae]
MTDPSFGPDEIARHFTRSDGSYAFARWARPFAPVVFGVEDETIPVIKGAIEAVGRLNRQGIADTDRELGVNLMIFFLRDWDEMAGVPDLDRLLPDAAGLSARLAAAQATQYRSFRFDPQGAIRACFVLLRMDAEMAALPAEALALDQAVRAALLWSDQAFATRSPLVTLPAGGTVLRAEIAQLIRAASDPVMPDVAQDPAHALRLAARIAAGAAPAPTSTPTSPPTGPAAQ